MSRVEKLTNGLRSVKIELIELNTRLENKDLSWYIEQVDRIIKILETNKSISSLFLILIELINRLKGKE